MFNFNVELMHLFCQLHIQLERPTTVYGNSHIISDRDNYFSEEFSDTIRVGSIDISSHDEARDLNG